MHLIHWSRCRAYCLAIALGSAAHQCLCIILVNSLLHDCGSLGEAGYFVLLDTDFGSIPYDLEGIIRSGIAGAFVFTEDGVTPSVMENGLRTHCPATEFTRHIEVDWEGKPANLVLCTRYDGRKIGLVTPTAAQMLPSAEV